MSKNIENKGRLAPQIIEAEAAVLGCILINPDAMAQSMQILDIDDFEINGDLVESYAFAYLAIRSLKKMKISLPETTGVKKSVTGGDIIN